MSIIIAAVAALVLLVGPVAVGMARRHRGLEVLPLLDEDCEVCGEIAGWVITSNPDDADEREIRSLGGYSAMAAYYCDEHRPENAVERVCQHRVLD